MLGLITDPAAPGGLVRRELPEPTPRDDEAIVAVRAFGVNRGELSLLERRPEGWMPGQDVAGTVVAAAADGSGPVAGSRVVAVGDGAGWSESVAVPSARIGLLPDGVEFADAAALPVAGLTALRALRTGGPVIGRRVLVTGATGGVGHFAVQLARVAGAHVTALVSGEHRLSEARALGAHAAFAGTLGEADPYDFVIDGVGGEVLLDALHHVGTDATVTTYGMASGAPAPIAFTDFPRTSHARLTGFFVYETDLSTFGADLEYLAGLVAEGRLSVESGVRRDWSETVEALEELRARRVVGKVTLTIG
ncbi:MAG TPA: zinc-binding dehydrogenase [Acidimicrobiales bacterium]|nr:zinc-binding dehydrogenase [Acidimicrobiales bacterium]